MMYTVLWTPAAEQELAALWLAAGNRNAVTSAANSIDQLLNQDPELRGVLCFDTVRTLLIPPLGVDFEIVDADRVVYVLSVWENKP